jgi:hypothetical protein
MRITATIAASGKGLKSACAVDIKCDKFTHARVIPFTKATVNQAELFALGYVLASVKPDVDAQFEITTFNTYVGRILERDAQGQFAVTPEKNIEQVKQVRELAGQRSVAITVEKTAAVTALRDTIKAAVATNA